MKNSQINRTVIAAWIQAALSALFIICAFLPSINAQDVRFVECKLSFFSCCDFFFLIFLLHTINIFVQAHGSCRLFSAIVSIISLLLQAVTCINLKYIMYQYSRVLDSNYKLMFIFYLITIILLAQLIIPTLIVRYGNRTECIEEQQDKE